MGGQANIYGPCLPKASEESGRRPIVRGQYLALKVVITFVRTADLIFGGFGGASWSN